MIIGYEGLRKVNRGKNESKPSHSIIYIYSYLEQNENTNEVIIMKDEKVKIINSYCVLTGIIFLVLLLLSVLAPEFYKDILSLFGML